MMECKKDDMWGLAKAIDKPIGFCIWYYYHKYEPSAYYEQLKQLMAYLEEKQESETLSSKRPTNSVPGMNNLGNTCYLSASIQILFGLPDFISDLYETYNSQREKYPNKKMLLTKAVLAMAVASGVLDEEGIMSVSVGRARELAADPTELKAQVDILTKKFLGFDQRDAHEFIQDIIDFLHEELELLLPQVTSGDCIEVYCIAYNNKTEQNEPVWRLATVKETTGRNHVLADNEKEGSGFNSLYEFTNDSIPTCELEYSALEGKKSMVILLCDFCNSLTIILFVILQSTGYLLPWKKSHLYLTKSC